MEEKTAIDKGFQVWEDGKWAETAQSGARWTAGAAERPWGTGGTCCLLPTRQ